MRTFSEGRLARSIAYLLTTVFLWSVGITGLTALPAGAQVVTGAATSKTVAVIPFENKSDVRPATLGDEAAAAVSVELRDRLLLDVLPKADVALQMRDLALTVPLTDAEMVRLSAELEVSLLVAGEVRGARITEDRDGRYADIVLAVRLFDGMARGDVNGAVVKVRSPSSREASDDVLIEKALQQAAFSAVQEMKSRPTITAMVLWARGDTVFLNVGSRAGVRAGMEMVAIRSGERVGRVRVTEADALGAYATVQEGPPLRSGDVLRAIYRLPVGAGPERPGVAEEKRKRFQTYALLAGVLFGFGSYASRTRRLEEGSVAAPNFQAAGLSNGAELGISGYLYSFHPLRDLVPRPAAILTWEGYQGTEKARIVGYDIRRSGQIVAILILDVGQDLMLIDHGRSQPGLETIEVTISTVDGGLASVVPEFTPWEPDFDPDIGDFTNPTWGEFVADNAPDAIIEVAFDSFYAGWFPSIEPGDDYGGMYVERAYQYEIRPLVVRQSRYGTWEFNHGTEFSRQENIVVGVSPAGVFRTHMVMRPERQFGVYEVWDELPNPEIRGNLATFFFYYPYGADQILLQVTRDPNFDFLPGLVHTVNFPPTPPERSARNRVSMQVDLAQVPGASNLFYWRVAARSSLDTRPPRSWPYDPSLQGFIYSRRAAFLLTASSSRAEMMHEQRATLDAIRSARARVSRKAAADRILRAQ